MSRKKPPLNAVELQKQLLVAESDVNRLELLQEWQTVTESARHFAGRAKSITALASAAAILAGFFTALRRPKAKPGEVSSSRFQTLWKGVRFALSVWSAIRARPRL